MESSKGNPLRDLRLSRNLPVKDMVEVVRESFPKYDKTCQSKAEHSEAYGMQLLPEAMTLLYKRFAPERMNRPKKDRHRLTCRIFCRLPEADYRALQQRLKADGLTVQDWLTSVIHSYLKGGDRL